MALIVQDLCVQRGGFQLEVPRLEIATGQICGLRGPSGSGKTTLLGALAGFLPIQRGRITHNGVALEHLPPEDRRIALIFQKAALFPHLNVFRNVEFGLRVARVPVVERTKRVGEWLRRLEIDALAERFPDTLSGGQAQRVALARALIVQFPVLLLDEPFTGLDDKLRQHLRADLKILVRDLNLCAVLVSHDPEDVTLLADLVVELENGKCRRLGVGN